MEVWLDTIDFDLISKTIQQLDVTGITTNPSILSKSTLSANATIGKLLNIQAGMLAIQVTANDFETMLAQAKKLASIDSRVIIKVPVTEIGLQTIYALSKIGIQTMATAIFETSQVLLSAMAGATYAAPYLGRIPGDNFLVLKDMLDVIEVHGYSLKLIVAAVRNKDQIVRTAKLGAHAITIPSGVFNEFISNIPQTTESLAQFNKDWVGSKKSLEY